MAGLLLRSVVGDYGEALFWLTAVSLINIFISTEIHVLPVFFFPDV